jgi:CubicO group peptidase (beta-lactamase class C family)
MKKILIGLLLVAISAYGLTFTNKFSHLRNFASWGPHSIFDFRTHPTRVVKSAYKPQPWLIDSSYNKKEIPDSLMKVLTDNHTIAFLVIQDGKIKYERYWDGHGKDSLSGSFSAAKSMISLLIGIALDEGKIKSLDQAVGDFIPSFKEGGKEKITIRNLLTMSSGTSWLEKDKGYFSLNAMGYYGDDEQYVVDNFEYKEPAGVNWEYRSGDTQALGLVVEKVFGKNISTLVSERFLQPMGAEKDALWLLDGGENHEKSFCCFNGIARDYARFGQLILNNGKWNDKQIVSEKYIKEATSPASYLKDPTEGGKPVDYYGFQYWILNRGGRTVPMMNGLFGQYVYAVRDKNMVIVRLGNSPIGKFYHHFQGDALKYLDAGLSVVN